MALLICNSSEFGDSVRQAIESGIVTSKARREVVQTLCTIMLQTSSEQYTVVCLGFAGDAVGVVVCTQHLEVPISLLLAWKAGLVFSSVIYDATPL